MKQLFVKFGMIIALTFVSLTVAASPSFLVVHNETDVESNAFLSGTPSPLPTAPNTVAHVPWFLIRLACLSQSNQGLCQAEIKMATNTPNPVSLGLVTVDIDSGEILPKEMSAEGYLFTATGPGEITLSKPE